MFSCGTGGSGSGIVTAVTLDAAEAQFLGPGTSKCPTEGKKKKNIYIYMYIYIHIYIYRNEALTQDIT